MTKGIMAVLKINTAFVRRFNCYAHKTMKPILLAIFILAFSNLAIAKSIDCQVNQTDQSVQITMQVPHPNHALVYRPNGETVWLQSSSEYVHEQVKDFANLRVWEINKNSLGTVWVNGEAIAQKIINGKGQYQLYIADNLETESENTKSIQCTFIIN